MRYFNNRTSGEVKMKPLREECLKEAAQMWCLETTERIEMIPELAEAFADHLLKYKKALDESYKAFHGIMNTPFDIEGYPDAKEAALGMNSEGLRMVNRIDEILSATVKPERVK